MKNKILHYKIKYYKWLGERNKIKSDKRQAKNQIKGIKKEIKNSMLNGRTSCNFHMSSSSSFSWEYWANANIIFKVKTYFTKKGYEIVFVEAQYNYSNPSGYYIISWEGK